MKYCKYYLTLAAVAAGSMLFGCSKKIVNQDTGSTAQVRISASAAASVSLAPFAKIRVNGADMPSMKAALAWDSLNSVWTGSLSVPSGLAREFILEAVDTMYGEGSIPDREIILYRAADTADLIANATDTIDFTLFPQIPLLTTSPTSVTVAQTGSFVLTLGLYHAPDSLFYLSTRISQSPARQVICDSVRFNFPADDSLATFAYIDTTVTIGVSETNSTQTLFAGQSYVQVATLYFHLPAANASIGTTVFVQSQYTSMYTATEQLIYPENFRVGWTEVKVNPPAQ